MDKVKLGEIHRLQNEAFMNEAPGYKKRREALQKYAMLKST